MANGSIRIDADFTGVTKQVQDLINKFNQVDKPVQSASASVASLVDDCKAGGQSMVTMNKDAVALAKALGGVATQAKQPRQALSELKKVLEESTHAYNQLTDAEKASPFGKALKSSIDQLTGRAKEMQRSIKGVSSSLRETGNTSKTTASNMGGLSSSVLSLGGNLLKMAGGLSAASAGATLLKDTLFATETAVDQWGATVESASAIYDSFCQALNNADFSSFFGNIANIVNAATDAYNAIDDLQTKATIRGPERAKLEAKSQELRAIIRTKGKDSPEGKAAAQQLKAIAPQLQKSMMNESRDNYTAFEALVKERLAGSGLNLSKGSYNFLMKTFSDEEAYNKLKRGAKGRQGTRVEGSGDSELIVKFDTRNTNQKLLDLFTDEWRRKNSSYLTASYTSQGNAASVDLQNSRYLRVSTPRTTTTRDDGKITALDTASMKSAFSGMHLLDFFGPLGNLGANLGNQELMKIKPVLHSKPEKEVNLNEKVGDILGGVGSIVSGIESMGIEIPEGIKQGLGVMNGIMSIVGGIATTVLAIEALSAADTFIPFAKGGIVHAASGIVAGHNYLDRVPATLTSGEMVINEADQKRLWDGMKSGNFGGGGGGGNSTISGEQIVTVINAYGRRTGRGEILR